MFDRDIGHLHSIQDSCRKILDFTKDIHTGEEFYRDQKIFDAVLMNFIVIGESVAKISSNLKEQFNTVEWDRIKAFRNIVAHNYFGVDADEVWQIVGSDITVLQKSIEEITQELEP